MANEKLFEVLSTRPITDLKRMLAEESKVLIDDSKTVDLDYPDVNSKARALVLEIIKFRRLNGTL